MAGKRKLNMQKNNQRDGGKWEDYDIRLVIMIFGYYDNQKIRRFSKGRNNQQY